MIVVKPPNRPLMPTLPHPWIFTAGSIEMGKAEDWQTRLTRELQDVGGTIFNPRRDDWDSSWEQKASNPKFHEQVTWEMDHLDYADVIIIYFDPNTKSPISLLELGLHASHDHILVCCPDGFWRKGNVEMVCKRYDIPLFNDMSSMISELKSVLDYIMP